MCGLVTPGGDLAPGADGVEPAGAAGTGVDRAAETVAFPALPHAGPIGPPRAEFAIALRFKPSEHLATDWG